MLVCYFHLFIPLLKNEQPANSSAIFVWIWATFLKMVYFLSKYKQWAYGTIIISIILF